MDEYYRAVQALPAWLARPLLELPTEQAERVHEIRMRVGGTLIFTADGIVRTLRELVGEDGKAVFPEALRNLRLDELQMEEIFYTLCGGSVHSHQNEIAAGYVTLPGGCRVGIGGQFLDHPEQGILLQKLRSLNLRISRQKSVVLPDKLRQLLDRPFTGMLLVGEPDSGKTTLLRSIAQYLTRQRRLTVVIDERGEIFPPQNPRTFPEFEPVDVISGIAKDRAVQMALRTLSPQVILLDELGGMPEVAALEQGLFSGVDFVATLHASSLEEACRRPQVQLLRKQDALRAMVLLQGRQSPGQIREVELL